MITFSWTPLAPIRIGQSPTATLDHPEAPAMMDYTNPLQTGAVPKGIQLNISATAQPQVILQIATLEQDGTTVSQYMTTGSFPDGNYPTASTADPASVVVGLGISFNGTVITSFAIYTRQFNVATGNFSESPLQIVYAGEAPANSDGTESFDLKWHTLMGDIPGMAQDSAFLSGLGFYMESGAITLMGVVPAALSANPGTPPNPSPLPAPQTLAMGEPDEAGVAAFCIALAYDAYALNLPDSTFSKKGIETIKGKKVKYADRSAWLDAKHYQLIQSATDSSREGSWAIAGNCSDPSFSGANGTFVAFRGTNSLKSFVVDLQGTNYAEIAALFVEGVTAVAYPENVVSLIAIPATIAGIAAGDGFFEFANWAPAGSSGPQLCVHVGFLNVWQSIRDAVRTNLTGLLNGSPQQTNIILTGHSLGGGLATLAAIDIGLTPLTLSQPRSVRLTVATYGSPKVGNQATVNAYNQVVNASIRIAHSNDLVPYVPIYGYCPQEKIIQLACLPAGTKWQTAEWDSEYWPYFPISHFARTYYTSVKRGWAVPVRQSVSGLGVSSPATPLTLELHTGSNWGGGFGGTVTCIVKGQKHPHTVSLSAGQQESLKLTNLPKTLLVGELLGESIGFQVTRKYIWDSEWLLDKVTLTIGGKTFVTLPYDEWVRHGYAAVMCRIASQFSE